MEAGHGIGLFGGVAVACAVVAGAILITHLVRRPPLATSKLALLLGLFVFPVGAAGTANVEGFQATQTRKFCGSCHVMDPHEDDSNDPKSTTLAAIHARNAKFGSENCYACHKDYGMYGYVLTKIGGLRHVYYYLTEYHDMPIEEAKHDIRIRAPFPNSNCMYCHTTTAPRWLAIGDHASSLELVRSGNLSCASAGCHGFAHPMTKIGKELPSNASTTP